MIQNSNNTTEFKRTSKHARCLSWWLMRKKIHLARPTHCRRRPHLCQRLCLIRPLNLCRFQVTSIVPSYSMAFCAGIKHVQARVHISSVPSGSLDLTTKKLKPHVSVRAMANGRPKRTQTARTPITSRASTTRSQMTSNSWKITCQSLKSSPG